MNALLDTRSLEARARTVTIENHIVLIFNSDPDLGAIELDETCSSFSATLSKPIELPRNSYGCDLYLERAHVWFNDLNISVALGNNVLHVEYMTVVYQVTIPDGNYDVSTLSHAINRELYALVGVQGLVTLAGDSPTGKVELALTVATLQIDFTQADTFRDVLGFDSQLIPSGAPSTALYYQLGDSEAVFNTIDYYLIHSDLARRGIAVNGNYQRVIAEIPITARAGEQIQYTPEQPFPITADNLIGNSIESARFWLTDQNNKCVDTFGATWSLRILLSYKEEVFRHPAGENYRL